MNMEIPEHVSRAYHGLFASSRSPHPPRASAATRRSC